jgi:hypothetical protein
MDGRAAAAVGTNFAGDRRGLGSADSARFREDRGVELTARR